MANIPPGKSSLGELVRGKPNSITTNSPITFRLKTLGGTTIEGTIMPNAPLTVTPGDDIEEYVLTIEDRPVSPRVVED